MTFLLLMTCWMSSGVDFQEIQTYQGVPMEDEFFLQNPNDVALDKQDRLHTIDVTSRTIFVWDKDGNYVGNYGKAGEGPGEFSFMGRAGGPQGYITIIEDDIYIFDGGSRKISIFDKDLNFKKSFIFNVEAGRVETFRTLSPNRYMVFYSSYFSDTPYRRVGLYDENKKEIEQLINVKDETWNYEGSGNNRRVNLHIYSPSLTMAYNQSNGQVMLGDSGKSAFMIFDSAGKKVATVEPKMTRRKVTKEDREEWESQPWFKSQTFFTTTYAEDMPFYDRILPVGKDKFLLYLRSPYLSNLEGYLVNAKGDVLGRFKMECGESGDLFGSMGRIFAFRTDEDGEFGIHELKVKPGNS